jgi:hypothetical protein
MSHILGTLLVGAIGAGVWITLLAGAVMIIRGGFGRRNRW